MKKLLLILPLLFEAISEGLELRGITIFKQLGKQVEVHELISWFLVIMIFGWNVYTRQASKLLIGWKQYLRLFGTYVLVYFLLRAILFNYAHNIAAGLPLDYLGTVSWIDHILASMAFLQWWMILLFQAICAIFVWAIVKNKI